MTLIWRGWGILILAPVVVSLVVVQLGVNAVTRDATYYETHGWPKLLALWVATAACWPLGRYMNRPRPQPLAGGSPDGQKTVCEMFSQTPLSFLTMIDLSHAQRVKIDALIEKELALDKVQPPALEASQGAFAERQECLRKDIRRRALQLLTAEQFEKWNEIGDMPCFLGMPVPGRHSLFFIPVQHWWIIFLLLGIPAASR
jgi:hypothetical protein